MPTESAKQKLHTLWRGGKKNGNFAYGEYLLALRLASELADLRAANANPYSKRFAF